MIHLFICLGSFHSFMMLICFHLIFTNFIYFIFNFFFRFVFVRLEEGFIFIIFVIKFVENFHLIMKSLKYFIAQFILSFILVILLIFISLTG